MTSIFTNIINVSTNKEENVTKIIKTALTLTKR